MIQTHCARQWVSRKLRCYKAVSSFTNPHTTFCPLCSSDCYCNWNLEQHTAQNLKLNHFIYSATIFTISKLVIKPTHRDPQRLRDYNSAGAFLPSWRRLITVNQTRSSALLRLNLRRKKWSKQHKLKTGISAWILSDLLPLWLVSVSLGKIIQCQILCYLNVYPIVSHLNEQIKQCRTAVDAGPQGSTELREWRTHTQTNTVRITRLISHGPLKRSKQTTQQLTVNNRLKKLKRNYGESDIIPKPSQSLAHCLVLSACKKKILHSSLPALLLFPSLVPLLPPPNCPLSPDSKSSCVSLKVYCQIPAYLGTLSWCVCVCVCVRVSPQFYNNQHSTAAQGLDNFIQLCLLGNTSGWGRVRSAERICFRVWAQMYVCDRVHMGNPRELIAQWNTEEFFSF